MGGRKLPHSTKATTDVNDQNRRDDQPNGFHERLNSDKLVASR